MSARAAVVPLRRTASSTPVLWSAVGAGVIATLVWAQVDSEGFATNLLRLAAGAFAGMTVGSLAVLQRGLRRPPVRRQLESLELETGRDDATHERPRTERRRRLPRTGRDDDLRAFVVRDRDPEDVSFDR